MLALALAALVSSAALAPQGGAADERARLVVLVAVDQMLPEHLERLAPWLEGGLGRFWREGRVFRGAELRYAATETAPGHATIATGTHPRRHGIVGNSWWERSSGRVVYCTEDPAADALRPRGGRESGSGRSPRSLRVAGLTDRLRAADAATRTVALGGKDRSAVLLGGQHPDWVLWWDPVSAGFASSSWYGAALPEWAERWNARWLEPLRSAAGEPARWVWEPLVAGELEGSRTAPDRRQGELSFFPGGNQFPHPSPAASELEQAGALARFALSSPLVDAFVLELAERAIAALELGADEHVDCLALALSACDLVGHAFGPYSREVTDVLLRLDRGLGRLFALLDERVGAGRWIAVLTADHGVLELPEALAERGLPAARLASAPVVAALARARERLAERFGVDPTARLEPGGWYFDRGALQAAGLEPRDVRGAAAQLLLEELPWLEAAPYADELVSPLASDTSLLALAANSFDPERSPDVLMLVKPLLLPGLPFGTSHGSHHSYDRAVPLVFLGPGFPAARVEGIACGPHDIVPTLLRRLGLPEPDDLDGRALD